jgi:hypothetical protein
MDHVVEGNTIMAQQSWGVKPNAADQAGGRGLSRSEGGRDERVGLRRLFVYSFTFLPKLQRVAPLTRSRGLSGPPREIVLNGATTIE